MCVRVRKKVVHVCVCVYKRTYAGLWSAHASSQKGRKKKKQCVLQNVSEIKKKKDENAVNALMTTSGRSSPNSQISQYMRAVHLKTKKKEKKTRD